MIVSQPKVFAVITTDDRLVAETHEVFNQPPPLENYNLFDADLALREAVAREGGSAFEAEIRAYGELVGQTFFPLGFQANEHKPVLHTHDRFGYRRDVVEYHPAYHQLMEGAIKHGLHSLPWTHPDGGAHVARAAMEYMHSQAENGAGCPLTMTFAAVPALRHQSDIAAIWEPLITSRHYDPRNVPVTDKRGATLGMAMTEKQGGSDVRANTTVATCVGRAGGGGDYELIGHKWFCSAPMCDAFLVLAKAEGQLSCFLVPRWRPDGTKNEIHIQRLKNKLGNVSNASSEIEFRGASQAVHHCQYREAFGKRLVDQPLMQNVLADLILESEAALALTMRVGRALDSMSSDHQAAAFARIANAIGKFWICKRAPAHIYEAMECLGGAGYVEESILPRLYREAPVNSIWEGSGNVQCLDVLRAINREPATLQALIATIEQARGNDRELDQQIELLKSSFTERETIELRARQIVERCAVLLQAGLLIESSSTAVADAFIETRVLHPRGIYGMPIHPSTARTLIERALPSGGRSPE
jgi:putative acyl-CoA dehydrogenase